MELDWGLVLAAEGRPLSHWFVQGWFRNANQIRHEFDILNDRKNSVLGGWELYEPYILLKKDGGPVREKWWTGDTAVDTLNPQLEAQNTLSMLAALRPISWKINHVPSPAEAIELRVPLVGSFVGMDENCGNHHQRAQRGYPRDSTARWRQPSSSLFGDPLNPHLSTGVVFYALPKILELAVLLGLATWNKSLGHELNGLKNRDETARFGFSWLGSENFKPKPQADESRGLKPSELWRKVETNGFQNGTTSLIMCDCWTMLHARNTAKPYLWLAKIPSLSREPSQAEPSTRLDGSAAAASSALSQAVTSLCGITGVGTRKASIWSLLP
ncbi:hypothetical protein C8J56DRAFT_886847 [Mycena floridula]|nr:hypothetical protein C8J56DRAFT_886847 [Mycena floridula]